MTDAPRRNGLGIIGAITSSLKDSPGLLVIAVLNIFIIATVFWSVKEVNARRDANLGALIEKCIAPHGG